MPAKVFIPQEVIDAWVSADTVELSGEQLTFRSAGVAVRLQAASYFRALSAGSDDQHRLLGRVKDHAALAALGGETYMNSVVLGDTAYDVETGFVVSSLPGRDVAKAVFSVLNGALS